MQKARRKPEQIEFITFDEFVEIGKTQPNVYIVNGVPWNFEYKGFNVTHEDDNCYLLSCFRRAIAFTSEDVLYENKIGEIHTISKNSFDKLYDVIDIEPKAIKEAELREMFNQYSKEEISFSRLCEMINERITVNINIDKVLDVVNVDKITQTTKIDQINDLHKILKTLKNGQ